LQGVNIFVNSVFADVVCTENDSRHVLLGLCQQYYYSLHYGNIDEFSGEMLAWLSAWGNVQICI